MPRTPAARRPPRMTLTGHWACPFLSAFSHTDPPGRRTVKTEPLPSHVAAHHARELAREGKTEPSSAVAARG